MLFEHILMGTGNLSATAKTILNFQSYRHRISIPLLAEDMDIKFL